MEDASHSELQPIVECGNSSAANCSYTISDFLCKTGMASTILMKISSHKNAFRISTENEREVFTVCVRYRDSMQGLFERDLQLSLLSRMNRSNDIIQRMTCSKKNRELIPEE